MSVRTVTVAFPESLPTYNLTAMATQMVPIAEKFPVLAAAADALSFEVQARRLGLPGEPFTARLEFGDDLLERDFAVVLDLWGSMLRALEPYGGGNLSPITDAMRAELNERLSAV